MDQRKGTMWATANARGMRRGRQVRQGLGALVLGVLCISSTPPASFAQQAEIDSLASRVAQEIAKTGKKKVAIADFVGVNGKSVPVGTWLADQFSAALAKADPQLEIIDRAKLKTAFEEPPLFPPDSFNLDAKAARKPCQSVGTEILVTGTLGPAKKAVGITLTPFDCLRHKKLLVSAIRGKISLNPEMEALLPEPPESLLLPGGVWKPGEGGADEPSCIKCPSPSFPDGVPEKNLFKDVLIEITVAADGHATDIKLVKSAGQGFDEQAIRAVEGWKFKPTLGPDGTPVPVRSQIEVTFRRM